MIQKYIFLFLLTINATVFSQTDFSENWEDFYSYNNVKDFKIVGNKIYAIVDNAVFIYDLDTRENKKISSVHGLSGKTTSSIYYSETTKRLIIGYTSGLLEVINENGNIHISNDIERLTITGSKSINHITEYNDKLYLSTAFALIEYDIDNRQFGDTFFIGAGSTPINIHQSIVFEGVIYATTDNGIFYADVTNPNLIDFNNWQQPQGNFTGNFNAFVAFNNQLFTSKNNTLYRITPPNLLQTIQTFPSNITNLNASDTNLNISLNSSAYTFDVNLTQVNLTTSTTDYDFDLYNSFSQNQTLYLATNTFGILSKPFTETEFEEIHPEGPLFNEVYSIEVKNNNLWVVYGAQTYGSYNATSTRKGFSHFNGEHWSNTPYDITLPKDLIDISIDANHENRAFISSWQGGLLEIVNDEIINHYDFSNSGLEKSTIHTTADLTYVSGSDFDKEGNLWVTNGFVSDRIKKLDTNGNWTGYNMNDVISGSSNNGLGDLIVDKNGDKWVGTRDFGALSLNKNGDKRKALTTDENAGNLPVDMVKAIAYDKNNRIWLGTIKGLVRFDTPSSLFNSENYAANPIIIRLDGGTDQQQGQLLLGDQQVIAIAIDGADNKWFGTRSSGVLGTNPSGQETLYIFNKDNSPLASNQINKIRVDDSTGTVYFATAKGIVAFHNNVSPFGNTLGETYAFPNPSTKDNEFITIDGRNGTHLPRGTNVKILDSAGYLVHETNVVEGIEIKGGKVIWNKTNLAGRKVASGIYIIMLTLPDKSETSITKVAIIN